MPTYYKRPGVYLEESLLVNPSDVASTFTAGAFVGAAGKGPVNEPIQVGSWSDFVTVFGGLNPISQPELPDINNVTSRLPGTAPADMTALRASTQYGDPEYFTVLAGAPFTAGQYVKLGDDSLAHFTPHTAVGAWVAGKFPGTGAPQPVTPKVLSYLPFAVYSFFQNGGRVCWVIRSTPSANPGTHASIPINGTSPGANLVSFKLKARSPGVWGNSIQVAISTQSTVNDEDVFAIQVFLKTAVNTSTGVPVYELVETHHSMSVTGEVSGSRRVDAVLNDPSAGSQYIMATDVNDAQPQPDTTDGTLLAGGVDPGLPIGGDLRSAAKLIEKVDGPIALNICGYLSDASKQDSQGFAAAYVGETVPSTHFDRSDIFVVNDSAKPREPGLSSSLYMANEVVPKLSANPGDSYSASYGPWIIIPNPSKVGTTMTVPPGGAVIGMMARIDATVGVFRAPAGVIAGLSNAVGVQTKFSDNELGDLNAQNINMVRSVVGAGICVMGGRTRKGYGADKYISARRTLIYIKEVMKRSTQFAVFENNDQRLWAALRMSAERILRPLWEAGGLAGSSSAQAYYITCDETINTPQVVSSGEVRMEVGVALEYPAEFVVIRITQFDRGTFTNEVQPVS